MLTQGDSIQVIQSYREPIFDIHFSADETQVASSSWDATMKVHDLETGKLQTYFDLANASAYQLIFHPNDLYLFTAQAGQHAADVGDRHQKRSPKFYWTHGHHIFYSIEQRSEVAAKLQLGWNHQNLGCRNRSHGQKIQRS